jgi:hypothetical protein
MVTMAAEEVNLKFLIDGDLRETLGTVLDRKGITLTRGMTELISWFCGLDDVAQSMVLGQISATPELIKIALQHSSPMKRVGASSGALMNPRQPRSPQR